jgi:hypothetical protein
VDGAVEEEEDVQASGEHVASVAAGGWGGEGYLQGELLGGRGPKWNSRRWGLSSFGDLSGGCACWFFPSERVSLSVFGLRRLQG